MMRPMPAIDSSKDRSVEPCSRPSAIPSERRIITVLAFDIVGSMRHIANCDPDEAQSFFDRCFGRVRKAVESAGGTLVSFEGDGGIAAFGWPSAHEDHADRACTAAWDIQNGGNSVLGPDGRGARFRVGLHSGLVAVRRVRRGGRARLDTVGATVHIAAKLQQSAGPGAIFISAEVLRLCRCGLALSSQPVPPVLDGITSGVFSFEDRPARRESGWLDHRYAEPMIGRQAELTQLRRHLPPLCSVNAAVGIVGEPGIGKSRMAAALTADSIAGGAQVLVFFGDAQKRTTPFAVARSLVEDALRSPGAALPDESRALAEFVLGSPESTKKPPAHSQATPSRKRPRFTERQLARLFVEAFCALALDRPTTLLVEDLHLIDPESREFLSVLASTTTREPLGLLLTGRPESLEWMREIARKIQVLESLPRTAMTAIGRRLWPRGRSARTNLDLLVERAEGNPLVLEELIHAWGDKAGGPANRLPQGIGSLIHVRLQRLSSGARSLAQALSLMGNVDIDIAAEVLGSGRAPLLDDMAELERFAFIHPPGERGIRMRHQVISEACAETIPHRRRRELHKSALRAIRSRHADLRGRHEQLAFHAEGAGDLALALDCLWQAALEARRSSAAASLNLLFDRAALLAERLGASAEAKFAEFLLMAFASMVQLGEFEKVNRHLPRVVDLTRRSGNPALVSSTLSQLGMICWFEGRYAEGLRATEEGLAIARTLESPALIYSNLIMQTNILHDMGQVDRAIREQHGLCEMLEGELEAARLGAAGIPSATALAFMSWFLVDVGAYEEGLEYVERALAIAKREGDAYSEVLARHALGRNLLLLHRNAEAAECIALAREISEREGYDAIKADLDGRMAIALTRTGKAAEAIALVEDCLRRRLHLRTGQLEIYYLRAGYAEALWRTGATDRALAVLGEALDLARRIHNPCLIVDALGLRIRILAELAPTNPQLVADLAERRDICARYGISAWPDSVSSAQTCPDGQGVRDSFATPAKRAGSPTITGPIF